MTGGPFEIREKRVRFLGNEIACKSAFPTQHRRRRSRHHPRRFIRFESLIRREVNRNLVCRATLT